MPVKQFDGRICPRPHNLVGIGECFCNMRNGFSFLDEPFGDAAAVLQ